MKPVSKALFRYARIFCFRADRRHPERLNPPPRAGSAHARLESLTFPQLKLQGYWPHPNTPDFFLSAGSAQPEGIIMKLNVAPEVMSHYSRATNCKSFKRYTQLVVLPAMFAINCETIRLSDDNILPWIHNML